MFPIGAEGEPADPVGVPLQGEDHPAGGRVVESDAPAGGQRQPAAGRGRQDDHGTAVRRETVVPVRVS